MTEALERLREHVAADRSVLERHLEKLDALDVRADSVEERCALVALTLHQTYTALENLFKHVAAGLGETFGGDRWHSDLLDAMTRPTDLRPAVVSETASEPLRELLAFRHYLIHGSVIVSPDGERLAGVRRRVLDTAPRLREDLDELDRHIAALLAPQVG